MELKVSVSEAIALIKEVENVPAKILEYIGMNIQKEVVSAAIQTPSLPAICPPPKQATI